MCLYSLIAVLPDTKEIPIEMKIKTKSGELKKSSRVELPIIDNATTHFCCEADLVEYCCKKGHISNPDANMQISYHLKSERRTPVIYNPYKDLVDNVKAYNPIANISADNSKREELVKIFLQQLRYLPGEKAKECFFEYLYKTITFTTNEYIKKYAYEFLNDDGTRRPDILFKLEKQMMEYKNARDVFVSIYSYLNKYEASFKEEKEKIYFLSKTA